ncbi:dihydrofolate reductase family protein [Brevibacterium sp. FAM 27836]|uniref:dihydrofolate reductase family protein n=1 Tax=Brevibacterium sp. FAM 27836 TaxID=3446693 RepID=UPI003F517A72
MTATYTWDLFTTVDGFGSFTPEGDWGGYWGKQGPEFLARRAAQYGQEQRLVIGARTFRMFEKFLAHLTPASEAEDPINTRMKHLPTTVISTSLSPGVDWPDATVETGAPAEVVARLKRESTIPLRSHGSPMLNRALLAAGLIDRIQVTMFPVISGRTGAVPMFAGAPDLDLELLETVTLDDGIAEVNYRPTLHDGRHS